LLVLWCAGDRCDMVGSDEDRGRSRRPCAEDRRRSSTGRVLSGRTIGTSGEAVCGLHHAQRDEKCGFLGLGSKSRSTVYQWFGLKSTGTVSPGLVSKLVDLSFPVWAPKLVAMVW
jgi:hypothetical protein